MLNKENIARAFVGSIASYDAHATVQKAMVEQLMAGSPALTSLARVLEIGCGTGLLTEAMATMAGCSIETLYLNDLSEELVHHASLRASAKKICHLVGDAETISFPSDMDLIISASCLQWFEDLPAFARKMADALKEGGHICIGLYGKGTMGELSALTGRGLHYYDGQELESIFSREFSGVRVQSTIQKIYFPNFLALLRHIRGTGVGAVGEGNLSVMDVKKLGAEYSARYGEAGGLPLSYNCLYLYAQRGEGC